jgi:hypothetical protein
MCSRHEVGSVRMTGRTMSWYRNRQAARPVFLSPPLPRAGHAGRNQTLHELQIGHRDVETLYSVVTPPLPIHPRPARHAATASKVHRGSEDHRTGEPTKSKQAQLPRRRPGMASSNPAETGLGLFVRTVLQVSRPDSILRAGGYHLGAFARVNSVHRPLSP